MTTLLSDPRNYIDQKAFPRLETLAVSQPTSFLRRSGDPSAAAETQLVFGEAFHVHKVGGETQDDWLWGQSESLLPGAAYPGYVGWVRSSVLSENMLIPSHKVISMSAPVFAAPNIKSPVLQMLPLNSAVKGTKDGAFIKTAIGFVHQNHAVDLAQPSRHPDWISVAESLIGQPYVWGGVSSFGLDCSGLVQTALRAFGHDAPRDSDQQATIGDPVEITDDYSGLKRGDLIFWKGHVGIMTSSTRLLHANAHHMMAAAEPLVTAVARIGEGAGAVTGIRRL